MSDETAASIRVERRDWSAQHRETYLNSGGARGHVMDLTDIGGRPFTTHCLIRCRGRRTGRAIVTPLIYGALGGEVVIVASKGGADAHPDWYLNIRRSPAVDVQIATEAFRATWREPDGAERDEVWRFVVGMFPPYAGYQASTTRRIPLVMLTPHEPIEVFGAG